MKRRTYRKLRAEQQPGHHHNVYVVLLDPAAKSLFMHWRNRQTRPKCKTTTDFFTAMNAEHHRYAIRCLHVRQPGFRTAS